MTARSVCAIIITFHPTKGLLESVAALYPQVSRLVIVDNGSSEASMVYIDEVRRMYGCEVILNGHNLGIAAALNIGVRYAESEDCEWVALFDQDSVVVGSFIATMLQVYDRYVNPEKIAIIAPLYIDRASSIPMPVTRDRSGNIRSSMTSGSLIPIRIFHDCGFFDETLFIDYADHDFCLRVRSLGYVIVLSEKSVLLHSLGAITYYRFLGKCITTTNHRASRRYYITRNRVWLYKKYIWKDFRWTALDMSEMIIEIAKILLLEQDRKRKLHNVLLGVHDAFCGNMGYRISL
jgi:rhamnosyltransferase